MGAGEFDGPVADLLVSTARWLVLLTGLLVITISLLVAGCCMEEGGFVGSVINGSNFGMGGRGMVDAFVGRGMSTCS